jgi:CheY-like chemotaxis protein
MDHARKSRANTCAARLPSDAERPIFSPAARILPSNRAFALRGERKVQTITSLTQNRKVLIVEDDADTREFLRTYLEHAGYESTSAANGCEGLHQLHAERPMLILLDLSMPVMTGWEFRAVQRALVDQELASVPVVITSALMECVKHAMNLGAMAVVPKPIDCDHLLTVLRRVSPRRDTRWVARLPAGTSQNAP